MEKIEKLVSDAVFFLLCLLTVLLLFESYLEVPVWMQPLGRMHPLVLHFPIAFVVLLVMVNLFRGQLEENSYQKINKFLLLLTAFTTVLAAIMGLFLSREEGYSSDMMAVHKWVGASVGYMMYGLLVFYSNKKVYQTLLYVSCLSIVVAGHYGAGLTHGADFIMAPVLKTNALAVDEKTPIFEGFIQPVIEAKCQSCHNPDKKKGQLDLSTIEQIHAGGENGPVWVAGDDEGSEIVRRALLPMEDDDHMPPKGKPQLTRLELALIKSWIRQGADETVSLASLSKSDPLHELASARLKELGRSDQPKYDFDFADSDAVAALNNPYRSVAQKSPNSPAIDVNIYGRQTYKPEFLTDIEKVREQVVSLNLTYLPIQDEDLKFIAGFPNLEKLILNFTDITGATLHVLTQCEKLSTLSLSGTQIDADIAEVLEQFKGLEELYLWNTPLDDNQLAALMEEYPAIRIDRGFVLSEDPLKLNPPAIVGNKQIVAKDEKLEIQHPIPGVEIRYTTDGSQPDSTNGLVYSKPLVLDKFTTLKMRALQDGWLPSDVKTIPVFVKGYNPKNISLLTKPSDKYKGEGARSLTDDVKGDAGNLVSPSWLGYEQGPMVALADFGNNPPALHEILLSYGVNIRSWVMLPTQVEVWAGNSSQNLSLQQKITLPPTSDSHPVSVEGLPIPLKGKPYRFYKVVAHPIKKLPAWHEGQGNPGWVFVDQLFFN